MCADGNTTVNTDETRENYLYAKETLFEISRSSELSPFRSISRKTVSLNPQQVQKSCRWSRIITEARHAVSYFSIRHTTYSRCAMSRPCRYRIPIITCTNLSCDSLSVNFSLVVFFFCKYFRRSPFGQYYKSVNFGWLRIFNQGGSLRPWRCSTYDDVWRMYTLWSHSDGLGEPSPGEIWLHQ